MYENFTYKNKTIKFWSVTGEIIDSNKYSETHVSSSGGGGYIGPYGGHVHTPKVRSRTVTNHEFWIRTKDGKEKGIKLHDVDIQLCVGQKVTIVSSGLTTQNSGYYTILANHNSKRYSLISDAQELNDYLRLEKQGITFILVGLITILYMTDSIRDMVLDILPRTLSYYSSLIIFILKAIKLCGIATFFAFIFFYIQNKLHKNTVSSGGVLGKIRHFILRHSLVVIIPAIFILIGFRIFGLLVTPPDLYAIQYSYTIQFLLPAITTLFVKAVKRRKLEKKLAAHLQGVAQQAFRQD